MLASRDGKIVCENTLDARLDVVFRKKLPEVCLCLLVFYFFFFFFVGSFSVFGFACATNNCIYLPVN